MGTSAGRIILCAGTVIAKHAHTKHGVHIDIPAEGIVCRITETEAYMGAGDAACHASDGRRTARTEVMFRRGGIFYVYLIYGMYHCANIVSGEEGSGEAVLLRSVEILEGHDSAGLLTGRDLLSASEVKTSARIGVEYAGDAALFPWRFYI